MRFSLTLPAGDTRRLLELAVTRDEFERVIWPTLRVGRPEARMPISFVWNDTYIKSQAYLARTLAVHGGRQYELVRIEFAGETTAHPDHEIVAAPASSSAIRKGRSG